MGGGGGGGGGGVTAFSTDLKFCYTAQFFRQRNFWRILFRQRLLTPIVGGNNRHALPIDTDHGHTSHTSMLAA